MNKYLPIMLLATFCFFTCNSPDNPSTTFDDHAAVTIALVAKIQAQSTYKLTISGPGMETIGPNEYAGGQTIELYVPVGKGRRFHFGRYKTGGILIDTGTTISDIGSGMNNAVVVTLAAAIAAPTISTHPAAQSAVEATTATFTISAIGTDLQYQWQKGTANINGATSVSYTTPELALTDAAMYRCVVSNPAGSVTSSEAALSVSAAIIAPDITTQPPDQTVTRGMTATFTINATGSDLKYQWQKGTVAIEGAVYSVYTIPVTAASDSGSIFRCIVSNSAGTKESNLAMLRVMTTITAPAITAQPSDQTVTEGQGATFMVVATGTNLNYQWQKGGENIPGATSAALVLQAIKFSESGSAYRCKVSNSAGSQTSNDGILTVKQAIVAPSILNHPEDQSITEGQTATFTIAATGTGLQFQWQKGIANIPGATGASFTTGPNPMGENNATFRCVVSNTAGSLTSNHARLTIVQKVVAPTINVHPSDKTVPEDQTAFFSIVAVGANLKYQWQKGTADIPGATNASYTTPATIFSDNNATFRCVVSNSAGTATSNPATLTVIEKIIAPNIIADPIGKKVSKGETATFTVSATGKYLKYQWQKGTAIISGATESAYTTPPTTMDDYGSVYRCVVSNSAGERASTFAILTVVYFIPPFLVDNFDDGNDKNNFGGPWYFYADGIGSKVPSAFTVDKIIPNNFGSMPFTYGAPCTSGTVCEPYVTIGTSLSPDGAYISLVAANEISFKIKSRVNNLTIDFKITTSEIDRDTSYCYYRTIIDVSPNWLNVTIPMDTSHFKQPGWTKVTQRRPFNLSSVSKFQWELSGTHPQTIIKGSVDTLDIDNVILK